MNLPDSNTSSTQDLLAAVVRAARDRLGSDISFVAEFQNDRKVFREASHRSNPCVVDKDDSLPLADTYCHRLAHNKISNVVNDAKKDPAVRDLAVTRALNIGAYIGVPVVLPDGEIYGTLCCINHDRTDLGPKDVQFLSVLADILSAHIARQRGITEDQRVKRQRIEHILNNESPRMVYQPIVNLSNGKIVAAEALARFESEPRRTPDKWFNEAWETGLGIDLEIKAMQEALALADHFPDSAYLTINLAPKTLLSDTFIQIARTLDLDQVVFEITEHEVVSDFQPLRLVADRLRELGARVAIDDVGAGYSGLNRILELRPDILKLDLQLNGNIHRDPAKQAMVSAVSGFASRTGALVVAEGIETAEEMETLQSLGVGYGQGYYFAKPGPLPLKLDLKGHSTQQIGAEQS